MKNTRLEAFSDGVFAVAITLLIFGIAVPTVGLTHLDRALLDEWPSFAAYAVSFLVIGIIWVNHHTVFDRIARVDRPLMFLNLFLLMVVAFIPFPTALLARYINSGANSHTAAALYSITMVLMSIGFVSLWGYAVYKREPLADTVDPVLARQTLPKFGFGVVAYLPTVAIAFVSAPLCLAVHAALATYYVFDRLKMPDRADAGITASDAKAPTEVA